MFQFSSINGCVCMCLCLKCNKKYIDICKDSKQQSKCFRRELSVQVETLPRQGGF